MAAALLNYSYAVILCSEKTGNLTAALSFWRLAVKSFHIDKVFLTAHPCFRKETVIFI